MKLQGSCHCRAVRFELESAHPYPFMRCYCSICRKTAGAGGYAINLSGAHATLKVRGKRNLGIYRALMDDGSGRRKRSSGHRHFCLQCGSPLWLWDPNWPELVHPHASSIDTPLPVPPEHAHIMLGSKANWVEPHLTQGDRSFPAYPKESIAQWHERLGVSRPIDVKRRRR